MTKPTSSQHSLSASSGDSRKTQVSRGFVSGSETVKVLPRPGSLATSIEPPCASAIHRASESPSPVPPTFRERASSTR